MTLFLENQIFMWMIPLVGVPILLHFLARARPPRYLFSATELIKKVVQQTLRVKKPKDRLLLLCRTLLCAVLLMIFLRPVIYTQHYGLDPDLPRNVVLVIDRSASMAWSEGGQSRFKTACNEASDIIDSLSSSDKANIIWIDKEPDPVFPEIGSNLGYLKNLLGTARVSHESGNPGGAMQLALTQLDNSGENRELCIISDFQDTQWRGMDIRVPDGITVSTIQPARDDAENGTVVSLRTDPISPLAGEPAQIICSLGNYSNTPRSRTVTLEIGEKRMTRQVRMPAWGQGAVAVEHVFTEQGSIPVSARLDEDAFGADDWRGVLVPVRDTLKIGLMGHDPHVSAIWQRALEALPWINMVAIQPDTFTGRAAYDLLMIGGWSGDHIDTLRSLRKRNIPLILSPAPGLSWDRITALTGTENRLQNSTVFIETLDTPMGMQIQDNTQKVFALFRDGSFGDPAHAAFTRRLRIPQNNLPETGILLFTDGEPALMQYADSPPLLLWLALLSQDSGDWTSQTAFLPFFGELIQTFRAHTPDLVPETALPGDTLTFEISTTFDKCRLVRGNGVEVPITRMDSPEVIRFVSAPVNTPGLYKWYLGNNLRAFRVVNFPVAESDLRTAAPPAITKGQIHKASHANDIKTAREGIHLWKILVWIALGLILTECALVVLMAVEDRKMAEGRL